MNDDLDFSPTLIKTISHCGLSMNLRAFLGKTEEDTFWIKSDVGTGFFTEGRERFSSPPPIFSFE